MKKLLLSGFIALAGLLLATTGAKAQTVNFIGTTSGVFSLGSVPGGLTVGTTVTPGDTLFLGATPVVTFTAGSFAVFTLGPYPDFASIGGGVGENLGLVTVGTHTPASANFNENFNLTVNFTVPTITSSTGNVFSTTVAGKIATIPGTNGVVKASFTPNSSNFTFSGPPVAGKFTLTVDDLPSITSGHSAFLTGGIVDNVVPEPGSLALILPGLAPLGFALRRRRRSSK